MNELIDYGLEGAEKELIRDKDGIRIFKVNHDGKPYVLKVFDKEAFRREIFFYQLLKDFNLPTIKVYGQNKASILLEDIDLSSHLRFAKKEDLKDERIIRSLADYYQRLHKKGKDYLSQSSKEFYSEMDYLNQENLEKLKGETSYDKQEFWDLLSLEAKRLQTFYEEHKTITYNDFFYGNMIVTENLDQAFLFDYNMMGQGLAGFDLMNVFSGLDDEGRKIFIQAYGNISDYEILASEIFQEVISLIMVSDVERLPSWAVKIQEAIRSDVIYQKLLKLHDLRQSMMK